MKFGFAIACFLLPLTMSQAWAQANNKLTITESAYFKWYADDTTWETKEYRKLRRPTAAEDEQHKIDRKIFQTEWESQRSAYRDRITEIGSNYSCGGMSRKIFMRIPHPTQHQRDTLENCEEAAELQKVHDTAEAAYAQARPFRSVTVDSRSIYPWGATYDYKKDLAGKSRFGEFEDQEREENMASEGFYRSLPKEFASIEPPASGRHLEHGKNKSKLH